MRNMIDPKSPTRLFGSTTTLLMVWIVVAGAPVFSWPASAMTATQPVAMMICQAPSRAPRNSTIPSANGSLSFRMSGYRKTVIADSESPIVRTSNAPIGTAVGFAATRERNELSGKPAAKGVCGDSVSQAR